MAAHFNQAVISVFKDIMYLQWTPKGREKSLWLLFICFLICASLEIILYLMLRGALIFPHLNDNTSSHVSVPPCETTLALVSIRSSIASVSFGVNQHPAFYVHAVNMGLNRRCFLGICVTRINSTSVSGRLLGSGCSLGLFVPSCGCLHNCTHIWGWKKTIISLLFC